MPKWTEHSDTQSRAVFDAFAEALQPVLNQIDPRWSVHHLELVRPGIDFQTMEEHVEIRIVIKHNLHGDSNGSRKKLEES